MLGVVCLHSGASRVAGSGPAGPILSFLPFSRRMLMNMAAPPNLVEGAELVYHCKVVLSFVLVSVS